MSGPTRWLYSFMQWFMPTVSKTGIYAATSPDLRDVTGHFIEGRRHSALDFPASYREPLYAVSEALVAEALATPSAAA